MKFLSILTALIVSITPAMAADPILLDLHSEIAVAEETKEPEVIEAPDVPSPVVTEAKDSTYAEKHPVISAPVTASLAVVKKAGKLTKTQKLGVFFKKAGAALSDGFVSFGKSTEKYHPALQTTSYAAGIVTPFAIGLIRR